MSRFPRKCLLAWLISCSLGAAAQAPAPPANPAPSEVDAAATPAETTATTDAETPDAESATEISGVEVKATYVEGSAEVFTEEKRASSEVTEQIGAEQIARSGDSDASSALKRVTGLTLVNDKFIYVRGLGERYSSTLLNNAQIPSPDPTRRVVPLDLFPTEILEGIAVQKTYSPDMPGEFGGGTVQLLTRGLPPGFVAKISLGTGWIDGSTFEDGLTYNGDGQDWTGFEGGARDLPGSIANRIAADGRLLPQTPFNPDGVTPAEYEEYGEDFAQLGFDQKEDSQKPIGNLSAAIGNRWDFDEVSVGFTSSLRYDNRWDTNEETRRIFRVEGADTLVLGSEIDRTRSEQQIDLSGYFNVGVEFGSDHLLRATTVLVRQTIDEARFDEGYAEDPGDVSRFYKNEWTENFLYSQQLAGEHHFPSLPDLSLEWQYTNSRAGSDAPANRQYRYDQDNNSGNFLFSSRADSNSNDYSDLNDDADELSAGLKYLWQFNDESSLTFAGGLGSLSRERDSEILRFVYRSTGPQSRDPNILILPPNQIFTPPNIGPNGFTFDQTGRDTDFYTAEQDLDWVHLGVDLNWKDTWRVLLGARREDNYQNVITGDQSNPDAELTTAEIDEADWLPALSVTWLRTPDDQFRFGYSETLSRPDFRELSLSPYTDPILDTETIGNPDLKTASIRNLDLRWEYYFIDGGSFTAGLFRKEFDNPIERVLVPGTGELLSYANVDSATSTGIEFDIYRNLAWVTESSWASDGWMADVDWSLWYLSANYTYVDSSVDLGSAASIQTTRERPLQGQSPYVVNLQIGYANPDTGRETSLLFNRFGERISNVGTYGAPDIYEEPFNQLDFVYAQHLPWAGLGFKARLKNLLDPKVEYSQGNGVTREYRRGREVLLTLDWRF